ncbi:hypothetical protein Bhyg_06567 [Pseudolycoriella hygida]|uniref:Uncharacterized protein n=1 Tax=Pseudolycoriella hygida TaxID=35572 RepID=A0A9Q0N246_9DIPT|nr:hypothetical protein Bhyg_06567 [Pseudolycoriella hygida]
MDIAKLSETSDLRAISFWAEANGLLLNADKSQAIKISGANWDISIPPLELNGVSIDYEETVKDLAIVREYRKILNSPGIPLNDDLLDPPVPRLVSRKAPVVYAKSLIETNFEAQSAWQNSWNSFGAASLLYSNMAIIATFLIIFVISDVYSLAAPKNATVAAVVGSKFGVLCASSTVDGCVTKDSKTKCGKQCICGPSDCACGTSGCYCQVNAGCRCNGGHRS